MLYSGFTQSLGTKLADVRAYSQSLLNRYITLYLFGNVALGVVHVSLVW